MDAYGCSISLSGTVQNETTGFVITTQDYTNSICSDSLGTIDITVAGGTLPYTFNWSNGESTEDLTNLGAGMYALTISDANGCEITTSQNIINETTGVQITNAYSGNDNCSSNIAYIDIVVSGGVSPYTYNWSNGATTQDLNNISEGNYYCIVTDDAGCMAVSNNYIITNTPSNLTASSLSTPEICLTGGSIVLTVNNGYLPYAYIWSNSETTQNISNLAPGNYQVTITDATGCSIIHNQNVASQTNTLNVTNAIIEDELCNNAQGSISISVTGGTPTYLYYWDNFETSQNLNNLTAGTYNLTITDANGCETTHSYLVQNNPGTMNIDTAIANHINCINPLGWIDLTYSGGTEPVSILWSNGDTEEDPEDLITGIYTLTITDANGCEDYVSSEIFDYSDFQITNINVVDDTCANYDGSVNISSLGGMQPLSYIWNNGFSSEDLFAISDGYYQCTITTADGCEYTTGNQFVDNIDGFDISAYITNSSCSTCNDGEIDITITGNGTNYIFVWSNGETTEDLTGLLPDSYNLTVSNDLGCHLDTTYNVSFVSGINKSEPKELSSIYPNPTTGKVYVKMDVQLNIQEVLVYNSIGELVIQKDIEHNQGLYELDLTGFSTGIYQIRLLTEKKIYNHKIVLSDK